MLSSCDDGGALNVGDGGAVSFIGSSPAYTGEMHFLNSKIYVATDCGLGSGYSHNSVEAGAKT